MPTDLPDWLLKDLEADPHLRRDAIVRAALDGHRHAVEAGHADADNLARWLWAAVRTLSAAARRADEREVERLMREPIVVTPLPPAAVMEMAELLKGGQSGSWATLSAVADIEALQPVGLDADGTAKPIGELKYGLSALAASYGPWRTLQSMRAGRPLPAADPAGEADTPHVVGE